MKTAIHVSTEAYSRAEDYAKKHNTSVNQMVEDYLLTLMVMGHDGAHTGRSKYAQLSPVVKRLGSLNIREFSVEEMAEDPRLEYQYL